MQNKYFVYQTNFSLGEISPRLNGRVGTDPYTSAASVVINFITSPLGCIFKRPGTYFISEAAGEARLVKFQYSNEQSYILEFSNNLIRFFKDQGIILSGESPYTKTTTYTTSQLKDLCFAQTFNKLIITHPDHKPAELIRISHDNWTLQDISFSEQPYLDENITSTTLTPSATTGSNVTITASSSIFASTDVGRTLRILSGPEKIIGINWFIYPGTNTQTHFDIPFYPNTSDNIEVYLVYASGERVLQTLVANEEGDYTVSGAQVIMESAPTTVQSIEIIQKGSGSGIWGDAVISSYTSGTEVKVTVNNDFMNTNASKKWRLGAWSGTTGYPALCCFHEQRLYFAHSEHQPSNLWGSQIGDFYNFSPDNADRKGQIDPDTSVNFQLSTVSINWIKGLQALVAGCEDGIIQIVGAGGAISAESVIAKKDLSVPSTTNNVLESYNSLIFPEELGARLHALTYTINSDGFQQSDIASFSEHLLGSSNIKQMAYSYVPNTILWVLLENGSLISCVFRPEKGFVGWTRHQLGGNNVTIESIECITGEKYSELWISVTRTINSSTKRYIEVLQSDFKNEDVKDAFFVDCGLSYTGEAKQTFSGIEHLEGETLKVLADGKVHADVVVSSGEITLDAEYTEVHAGLGYNSDWASMPIDIFTTQLSTQSSSSRIIKATARLLESSSFKVGSSFTGLQDITVLPSNFTIGSEFPLYSGDIEIFPTIPSGFGNELKFVLRHSAPLPFTITSLAYRLEINNFT